jgi:hypothetical protein
LLALAANGRAADDPPAESLAERVQALVGEFSALRQEIIGKLGEAKTDEERQKLYEQFQTAGAAKAKAFLELAKSDPKDPAALQALEYAIGLAGGGEGLAEALKIVSENFAESKGIGQLAMRLSYTPGSESVALLERIASKNPNDEDKGMALFALGEIKKRQYSSEGLSDTEREEILASATRSFETLKEKYADVQAFGQTLGKMAEARLAALKNLPNLVVGKVAPEIDGEDLDGMAFKLSDYRGQVVLLDYWAHW